MNNIALCIGNSAYPGAELKNAGNDANDVSERLEALGFSCRILIDGTNKEMADALKQFREDIDDSEVALFFFAGHGMQIEGENYLNAIDTEFDTENDAKFSSLPLNKCIDTMEKGANETSIVILDACRSNPFERKWRGKGQGLASVYAPKGTIIAYATSPGQTASDGAGDNGEFTRALLSHLEAQNVTIEDLFKRVRNSLSAATSGKQTSWEHTSLMGDFFFNTSFLTGELIAEYSSDALADSEYNDAGARAVDHIIRKLKSHDWYSQNPAMNSISPDSLEDADKDALFVLGRNVYQAACGTAKSTRKAFADLGSYLQRFDDEVAFHMLNGMLFEVYFDSAGRFRRSNKKVDLLDKLMCLEDNDEFSPSFNFIRQALLSHQKQLFYVPGSGRDVVIDVELRSPDEGRFKVQRVFCEGQDVFYSCDGTTLVANDEDEYLTSCSQKELEDSLRTAMAVPRRRLQIKYSVVVSEEESDLLVPFDFKILRFGL